MCSTALSLAADGYLYLTANQFHRRAQFQKRQLVAEASALFRVKMPAPAATREMNLQPPPPLCGGNWMASQGERQWPHTSCPISVMTTAPSNRMCQGASWSSTTTST